MYRHGALGYARTVQYFFFSVMLLLFFGIWLSIHPSTTLANRFSSHDPPPSTHHEPSVIENANHIFNTIHSAARQWGSSLNHNGMSYFIAEMPAGVQLYHGSGDDKPVKGMEWLAFEPEHALGWAFRSPEIPTLQENTKVHKRDLSDVKPPSPAVPNGAIPDVKAGLPVAANGALSEVKANSPVAPNGVLPDIKPYSPVAPKGVLPDVKAGLPGIPNGAPSEVKPNSAIAPDWLPAQKVPKPPPTVVDLLEAQKDNWTLPLPPSFEPGFLHTYRTKRPLRFLYIDGMSGGKTEIGTLDTQDLILFPSVDTKLPIFGDLERGKQACYTAALDWEGKIDGIVRMEAGFEIILCDFKRSLDVVTIHQAYPDEIKQKPGSPPISATWRLAHQYAHLKAIASRYWGLGGDRIKVDFSRFVSAYAYDIPLFSSGKLPRLVNSTYFDRNALREDVRQLITKRSNPYSDPPTNWQTVTDMIVSRWSRKLQYLLSPQVFSIELLHEELDADLQPFINYTGRNAHLEAQRCMSHFLPHNKKNAGPSIAALAITAVLNRTCSSLVNVYDYSRPCNDDVEGVKNYINAGKLIIAKERLVKLVNWLQWTTWKECQEACGYNEVCFLPIWPMGTAADHLQPTCKGYLEIATQEHDYWGLPQG